jgi:ribosomal protein L11 methyltransferase
LYAVRAKLPAHLDAAGIKTFSEKLSALEQPFSVLRENNNPKAGWILEWIISDAPDKRALAANANAAMPWDNIFLKEADLEIQKIPETTDWLAHSYRQFPAFSVGPFYIYGSHCKDPVPDGQLGLQIDAATAFGSGEHGTTKGCMMAMLDLKGQGACPWNVLDMGTGSGILGLAAWTLWKTPVLAVDNDPEAVRVAVHHAAINKVPAAEFLCAQGDGFAADIVQEKKPFDLIIANILAGPLKDMAGDLMQVSDENGYVILSGILNEQANGVLEAYKNFRLRNRYDIGEWSTLVLQNAAA